MQDRPASKAEIATLAGRAVTGDQGAFGELVRYYHERIFRLVYYRTRSRSDAEDLTQEVFIKAFNKLGALREVEHFQSWLFSIAVNTVRDLHRKRKVRALLFLERGESRTADEPPEPAAHIADDSQATGEEYMAAVQFWRHLEVLADRLGAREREVFMLRYLDGLEIKEIAAVIGKTEGTVKTSLHRAVKKFQKDATLRSFLHEVAS